MTVVIRKLAQSVWPIMRDAAGSTARRQLSALQIIEVAELTRSAMVAAKMAWAVREMMGMYPHI